MQPIGGRRKKNQKEKSKRFSIHQVTPDCEEILCKKIQIAAKNQKQREYSTVADVVRISAQ